jgi:uncharacterized cupin superfamily protein
MVKPIMNLDDVAFDDIEDNGLYTSKRGQISDHIGARQLGYNLTVLPPGKAQCPFHCHHAEEEMFLIIEGEGELRFGDERYPIRPHDVIACPPGGAEVAHQIINTGRTTMRYLALSTLAEVGVRVPGFAEDPDLDRPARRQRPPQDLPRRRHGRLLRPGTGLKDLRARHSLRSVATHGPRFHAETAPRSRLVGHALVSLICCRARCSAAG